MVFLSSLIFVACQAARANPEIAFQIEAMVMADQEVRMRLLDLPKLGRKLTLADVQEQNRVDRENTRALKELVGKHGWLTPKLVGAKASHQAWLLVQHADQDPRFQERCLGLMEPLIKTGGVQAQDYAYLFDRVATAQGRPQRYGTQFLIKDGKVFLKKVEDPSHLDQRRKKMGMMPMAEYRKLVEKMYGIKK